MTQHTAAINLLIDESVLAARQARELERAGGDSPNEVANNQQRALACHERALAMVRACNVLVRDEGRPS